MPLFDVSLGLGIVLVVAGLAMLVTTTISHTPHPYISVARVVSLALQKKPATRWLLLGGVLSLIAALLLTYSAAPSWLSQDTMVTDTHRPTTTLSGSPSAITQQTDVASRSGTLLPAELHPVAGQYQLLSYHANGVLQKVPGTMSVHATGRVGDYDWHLTLYGLDSQQQAAEFIYQGTLHQTGKGWFLTITHSNDQNWQDQGEVPVDVTREHHHLLMNYHYGNLDIAMSWKRVRPD